MTDTARIKLAAVVVALFLAAVSAAGVLSHTRTPALAVTGQVPSTVHASAAPAQIHSLTFEHENND